MGRRDSLVFALFGFSTGLFVAMACATSDQAMEAQQQLVEIEKAPRKKAECKPGIVEPCYAGPANTAGRGICREGQRQCDAEGFWSACAGEKLPQKELCNKTDDDCDGVLDNDFEREGAICFRGKGACKTQGTWSCSKDGVSSECSAAIAQPSAEKCDNVDNDCDGETDEGDVEGTGDTCTTGKAGVCGAGTKRCVTGAIRCMQNVQPGMELCNKLDDDCDGQVDDDCAKE